MSLVFRLAARHGRFCLILGLIAGLTLPGLAREIRNWLPHLVGLLLFLSALRIGPRAALGGLSDLRQTAFHLGLGKIVVAGVDGFEFAAVNGHKV